MVDPDSIDWRARERAVEIELEALRARRLSSPWRYMAERFAVRSARIICGLVSVAIGLLLINAAPSVMDTPFAQLTLGTLIGWAGGWILGGWFVWWGIFKVAFGPGPTPAEVEEDLQREASRNVDGRF